MTANKGSNWIVTLRGADGMWEDPEVRRIEPDQIDRYQEVTFRLKDCSIVADVRMQGCTKAEAIGDAPDQLIRSIASALYQYGVEAV
jgi:hypothetical protein